MLAPNSSFLFPLLDLTEDLILLVILELPSGPDVKALSRTCHVLNALVVSGGLELAAAWLWRQHGNEALFKAQAHKDVSMLRQLIHVHLADVEYRGASATSGSHGPDHGCCVLHSACSQGQLEVVQFLLTLPGLQVNEPDQYGLSALQLACSRGEEAVVLELLKHPSINVNLADTDCGLTALHYAVVHNRGNSRVAAARALLGHPGIDVHIRAGPESLYAGLAALAIAEKQWGQTEMRDILAAHQSKP